MPPVTELELTGRELLCYRLRIMRSVATRVTANTIRNSNLWWWPGTLG